MIDKESTQEQIEDLLNKLAEIDEAREHQCLLEGRASQIMLLLAKIAKTDYAFLSPAWGIPLYLSRN